MSRPSTPIVLSFRRTFALLILLVVLPSAGLSGFGVVAIINERAAVEKRLEAAWHGHAGGAGRGAAPHAACGAASWIGAARGSW